MSRNSSREESGARKAKLTAALKYYFEYVLSQFGWTDIRLIVEEKRLIFSSRRFLGWSQTDNGYPFEFRTDFSIKFSSDGIGALENWLLYAVVVKGHTSTHPPTPTFLPPIALLMHWNKRFATEYDSTFGSGEDLWLIRSARNFQSLLEAYDELAILAKKPFLFTSGKTL